MSRVAIVTGGGRGIGSAVAHRLAADGHAVAVVDLDQAAAERTAQEIIANGGHAAAFAANVANGDEVKAAVHAVVDVLGPPAVLVSNAGILRDNLLFRMSDSDWDAVMDVHLRGTFLFARETQGHMRDHGFGRIIALSSTSALGKRGQANYAAAKAGIQGFIKSLAIELGRYGITANAVAPGYILTEMAEATAARLGITVDELSERNLAGIPVNRPGTSADVAQSVSFFADERSGFVNGQVLYVAGGPRT